MSLKAGLNPGLFFFWLVGQLQTKARMIKSLSLFFLFFTQATAYARIETETLLKVPGIVHVERIEPAKGENQEKYIYFSIRYKSGRRELSSLIAYPRHFYQRIPAVVFTQNDDLLPSFLPEINTEIFGGNGTRLIIFSEMRGVEREKETLLKIIRKLPLVDKRHIVFANSSKPALSQMTCEEILKVEFDDWIWKQMMRGL